MKKKILIFYASFGWGHYSAAKAIKEHIEKQNLNQYEIKTIDFFKEFNPLLNKIAIDFYWNLVKHFPRARWKLYKTTDHENFSKIAKDFFTIISGKMLELLETENPDIIISTHFFPSQMCAYLKNKHLKYQLATIITDFTSHEQWTIFHEFVDYFFVANDNVKIDLIKKWIKDNKIYVTWIPISDRFWDKFDWTKIKKEYNLSTNIKTKTILFFTWWESGNTNINIIKILETLIKFKKQLQTIVITWKNINLQNKIQDFVDSKNAWKYTKVLWYSDKIPELMYISDLVISKPWWLTTTESIISNTPMLIITPIPWQEEINSTFLESMWIWITINNENDIKNVIDSFLKNPTLLENMKQKFNNIQKIKSTQQIFEILLK